MQSLGGLVSWAKWTNAAAGASPSLATCCHGPTAGMRWVSPLLSYPHLPHILLPPSSYTQTFTSSLLPFALSQPTILFRRDMRKIILSNAFIVGTHFLAGFILQVVVYGMIIRLIRRMRKSIRGELQLKQHGHPVCVLVGSVYICREV